jgi:glycosyltransferase involved in cell wall biosynthesis
MGLRDPWTGFISAPHRWFLPAIIDKSMEKKSIEVADAVEIAWEGIGKDLAKKYSNLDLSKLVHIPNGFDSEDYPHLLLAKDKKFCVTYTGSLYGKRNPKTLLDAVKQLRTSGEVSCDNFKMVFAGRFGAEVRDMFTEPELDGLVEVKEYLPHEESIKLLLQSDLLVLIVDESELSDEIVPGKVFEYIGARRPIIAFAPDGAAARVIRHTGTGIVIGQNDVEAAKAAIISFFSRTEQQKNLFAPDENAIKEFERKEAARNLSVLFNNILERQK